jgi:hypothetical protein
MQITFDDLTVDSSGFSEDSLRQAWRCLVGDSVQLLLVSALGDMFLVDSRRRVHWLDVHGQIHAQVKDLPPGTRIGEIAVRDP